VLIVQVKAGGVVWPTLLPPILVRLAPLALLVAAVGWAWRPQQRITFSLVSVAWLLWPGWRWLWSLAGLAIVVGLLGMNYHFVSDIAAGALWARSRACLQ